MRKILEMHGKKDLNRSEKATFISKDDESWSKNSSEKFLRSDK